jgi:hypothetical protein
MRIVLAAAALVALAALAGCTQAQEQEACALDQTLQPGVASAVSAMGSQGAAVAAVDTTVVHPIVQSGCAALSQSSSQ